MEYVRFINYSKQDYMNIKIICLVQFNNTKFDGVFFPMLHEDSLVLAFSPCLIGYKYQDHIMLC